MKTLEMNKDLILNFGSKTLLGEGLFYHHEKRELLWVDILGNKLYRYSEAFNRITEWGVEHLGLNPSVFIPLSNEAKLREKGTALEPFQYIVSFRHQLHLWDPIKNQSVVMLSLTTEHADQETLNNLRFNDGKCDPSGRLWIGTMDNFDRPNRGSFYRSGQTGQIERKFPTSISNGLCWNQSGTRMYYIDTPDRSVKVFEYNPALQDITGVIDIIDLTSVEGKPDGMTIDENGCLWIAMWDGGQVICLNPETKQVINHLKLDGISRPTNCTFGGEFLNQLYISTAYVEGEKNSGHILKIPMTIKGAFSTPYNFF